MTRSLAIVVALTCAVSADTIDTPAWPANAKAIELTWLVSPAVDAKSPLELVVAIGAVERHVKLAPELGQLVPMYQSVCGYTTFTAKRGELAQINFEEGGFGGDLVRRAGSDALEIVEWSQEDGGCEVHGQITACPRKDKLVARMHVPVGFTVREHVLELDVRGKRTALACK
jgi:hypothetical protein